MLRGLSDGGRDAAPSPSVSGKEIGFGPGLAALEVGEDIARMGDHGPGRGNMLERADDPRFGVRDTDEAGGVQVARVHDFFEAAGGASGGATAKTLDQCAREGVADRPVVEQPRAGSLGAERAKKLV